MTRDEIQAEFDKFIEFPTDDKSYITTVSALLFAEHIAALVASNERELCAMLCDDRANLCASKADTADSMDDAIQLKSLAWQFSVLATKVRARGDDAPHPAGA